MSQLNTVGAIARALNVTPHQVTYVIRSRGLEPADRAGNLRVFSDQQVEQITTEIRKIQKQREGVTT